MCQQFPEACDQGDDCESNEYDYDGDVEGDDDLLDGNDNTSGIGESINQVSSEIFHTYVNWV